MSGINQFGTDYPNTYGWYVVLFVCVEPEYQYMYDKPWIRIDALQIICWIKR